MNKEEIIIRDLKGESLDKLATLTNLECSKVIEECLFWFDFSSNELDFMVSGTDTVENINKWLWGFDSIFEEDGVISFLRKAGILRNKYGITEMEKNQPQTNNFTINSFEDLSVLVNKLANTLDGAVIRASSGISGYACHEDFKTIGELQLAFDNIGKARANLRNISKLDNSSIPYFGEKDNK